MDMLRDPAHGILVHRIARATAEISELQLDGRHLGGGAVRAPVGGVSHACLQVDVGEGDAGLRLEAAHQPEDPHHQKGYSTGKVPYLRIKVGYGRYRAVT